MQTLQEKQQVLQAAIENLYVEFSSYKLRVPIDGCSCCVSDEDQKRLVSKPLRQLEKDDLSRYASCAMTTWGDEYDYKHFLPRILELLAADEGFSVGAQLLSFNLPYAEWQTWPESEKTAVINYLLAVWDYVLEGGNTSDVADGWIDAIAEVVDDLKPFLLAWEQNSSAESCDILLEFCEGYYMSPSAPQVVRWLQSDKLLQLFEQRCFEAKSQQEANLFAQVVKALNAYKHTSQSGENDESPSN